MSVLRVYVEKRPGFDIEAHHILSDLQEHLGLRALTGLRLANRYDVEGLSAGQFESAKVTVFSEPNQDFVYDERWPTDGQRVFAIEYLPGQYDQRADSAAQCIQLLTQGERPKVTNARVYALEGDISDEDFERIQHYLVNPVESRIASMEKPENLDMEVEYPGDVPLVEGFIRMDADAIAQYWKQMGFAMSVEDLRFCQDYFRDTERRDPTVTELRVIDTYWSDHCRHTTFLTKLDDIKVEPGRYAAAVEQAIADYFAVREDLYGKREKNVCLMDMAVIGAKYLRKQGKIPDLDVSEEINACSIQVPVEIDGKTEQWLVQFKNETHNHPTEIEPFGGAATCLGGAIRDPLSGRAYVYQAMRVTGSGDPTAKMEDTIPGKLPQRKITTGAASGYSSYGNQIGLATGQVTELYHPGYMAKRLEIGAVVGASPKENVMRGVPEPGDTIVLLGGRTGRDGCGGATGSSKAHTDESLTTCGAEVQKGNPPIERKLQRLFRNPEVSTLIKRCNDFGAGGVCVAIGELADGLRINLDSVPRKYEGLDGTELAISESQERMAVVLDSDDVHTFIEAADAENLEATPVAVVTGDDRLRMTWRDDVIVDISRDFLNTNGVTQHASAVITPADPDACYLQQVPEELKGKNMRDTMLQNMSRLEVCCQKGLSEMFDASIGAASVLMPFAGKYQLTPEEAMVAKLPLLKGQTDDATVMGYGFIPKVSQWSPFHGAAWAVVESLSKLAAVGADALSARLTFQEYFERLHDVPQRWGKPTSALLGALTAQLKLGIPSIGGKDSMSGSFNELDVPPTLVSFALAMTKASRTISAAFQQPGSRVVCLPIPTDPDTMLPDWDQLKAYYQTVFDWSENGAIRSASVVREGGVAAGVARMSFGNRIGLAFAGSPDEVQLFAPREGSLVLELDDDVILPKDFAVENLGTTTTQAALCIGEETISIDELQSAWMGKLEKVFPVFAPDAPDYGMQVPLFDKRPSYSPSIKEAKPRVLIPVFPGTNCEIDTARAFEKAGAIPEIVVVNNLTAYGIEQTIDRLADRIKQCQMIMLPGGFSGGDEPDGSGKFIATTLRNPRIAEAIQDLLKNRDGLMLGICNGFQALIKLGLLPHGEIRDVTPEDPTLTFNTLGRHVSRMVYTRVTSVKSPWLSLVNAGDIHTVPVSHGEGRFVASKEVMERLIQNGQIAFQYVDPDGIPSNHINWNPNGSVCAVEGICSPDGRILGKMGHSERKGTDLYKNVPGEKDQLLFESGVQYFK
ncbi:phosphoribosylformylglycinamidine synthase [Solibaculum mannosilyticum]|uniref:Phosphoribosylformylglycinamidine synthase n=1 Tax=Solibaculum mannosilyticum TaxID=2780922 RepID=A0A7I8D7A8_9FIRM|nr:phosphoribosylformylglycinamidine synthase [Solibaculum mannosilyticum]BCI61113.1 phosphoribosylformylglycinamidine synthase [Solibaculum mannosilyticum]